MAPSRAGTLALVGNNLGLDFANTASGRGGPQHQEHLQAPEHLLLWASHAGILTPRALAAARAQSPSALRWQLTQALTLREAIYRAAAAIAAGEPAPGGALRAIGRSQAASLTEARLEAAPDQTGLGRYAWRWPGGGAAALLGPVALAAVELLARADGKRIKICPGEHCGWAFLDISKNGRRRWCEMEVCGNRAKARRFAARRRAETACA